MMLVDTSVWVDHLRRGNTRLEQLLLEERVLAHPFVIGELACGRLHQRAQIMALLLRLPAVGIASHTEALHLVDFYRLDGQGLGWIDVHLLASAAIAQVPLWTLDRRLEAVADRLAKR